jgi:hypothetical protein
MADVRSGMRQSLTLEDNRRLYDEVEAGIRAGNPTAVERLREIVAARRDQAGDYARRDGLRAEIE